MISKIHKSWAPLKNLFYKEPLSSFHGHLANISFQPKKEDIFNVFQMPLNEVRVVILGQDPYPIPGDAMGYAYATRKPSMPEVLKIIAQEITQEEGLEKIFLEESTSHPWQSLQHWRDQGVFLLNTALTVETGRAGSHLNAWKQFTIETIKYLSHQKGVIWLLWGKKAQDFIPYIANAFNAGKYSREEMDDIPAVDSYNYIIACPHPAAEAYASGKAGFFGSDCFYTANRVLLNLKSPEIFW